MVVRGEGVVVEAGEREEEVDEVEDHLRVRRVGVRGYDVVRGWC